MFRLRIFQSITYEILDFPTLLFFMVFHMLIQDQKGWEGGYRERLGPHRLQSKADLLFLRGILLWYITNLFPTAVTGSVYSPTNMVSHRLILGGTHSCTISCYRCSTILQENRITEQVQANCRKEPAILKHNGLMEIKKQNSLLFGVIVEQIKDD